MDQDQAIRAASTAIDGARDQIVATLQALIAVPSVNPNYPHFEGVPEGEGTGETAAQAVLRPVYEAAGCEIDQFEAVSGRANLVGVLRGSESGGSDGDRARSLIFNGHVDTVAPGDPARWTSGDPFDGRVEDGQRLRTRSVGPEVGSRGAGVGGPRDRVGRRSGCAATCSSRASSAKR